jgi:uncharacterized membrane protein
MERKTAADVLKGIAVILMIQVHLTELFATNGFYESIFGRLSLFLGGPPAAPVFIAVMGYFLACSKKNTLRQVFRGIKLLILGLMLNILLNAHALINIATGDISLNAFHLIFGVDILFLAGFSVIIIALLKPLIKKHFAIPFILVLIVAALSYFFRDIAETGKMNNYFIALAGGNYSWSYFPVFPWLAYPLAGFGFKLFEKKLPVEKFPKGIFAALLIVIMGFLTFTIRFGISVASDLKHYYHHDIVYALWVFCFLIFWSGIIRLLCKRFKTSWMILSLMWVGKNVTAFYVIQWLIIGNIATSIYRTQEWPWLLLWFLGITGICTFIVWLWNKFLQQRNKDKVF